MPLYKARAGGSLLPPARALDSSFLRYFREFEQELQKEERR
jgi:hypothetical protein